MARLPFDAAQTLAARAFARAGVAIPDADSAAQMLTLTEAMGISTHGLVRVRDYTARIAAGGIDAQAAPQVERPAPALLRIDGARGLGPAVAFSALEHTMQAARQCGVAAAFLRRASHLGALAPYLFVAAEHGFAAVITSNTAPMMAPAGGRAPVIGNNPLGFALPHPEGRHVILDMALSVVSRSRVRAAARAGTPIPDSWATGPDGLPTTDPAQAMRGLMSAIGGDKGANLALCLDLMAGGLSGAAMLSEVPTAADTPGAPQDLGQMILLVDAARLLPDTDRAARLDTAARIVGQSPALNPAQPPRLPGARALARLQKARAEGIDIPSALLSDLETLAGQPA
ncbi:Ldh family oxidoreductase [Maliponia aquimaris]|uniref:(2R)-3-sulfolactate dehydrogenase (NADP(+)) n=1 Tax=Maliponia aquimaris TaxID=1673631 RepID=A0A238KNQ2_9RHOB|nr:Ldh family oxidoreductase [Maliponia aquimaris]SMX44484.1 (2R)-3-sulfolactate dehydrogenase (NADP(+)) [Maliponia aquimaris]